ncbi:HDOD domain-containing protein [Thermodesulfobacteriota bacterium]
MDTLNLIQQMITEELAREKVPLPVPDIVSSNLQELLGKENVKIEDISQVVSQDSSLTAKVLSLANSPFYSGLVKIRSIDQAITRVGLNAVKSLIMTIIMKDVFNIEMDFLREEFRQSWKHSLACGICAKKIARQTGLTFLSEDAYLLGLLHDIGAVLIFNSISKLHQEKPDLELSRAFIIETVYHLHAPVGGAVLKKLHFNENFCAIVEMHHNAAQFENAKDTLFNILQLSDVLLRNLGISFFSDSGMEIAELPAFERLNLNMDFISEIETSIGDIVSDCEQCL